MPDFDSEIVPDRSGEVLRVKLVMGALNVDNGDLSASNPLPITLIPSASSIVSGANNGTATQTVTDITGATNIPANTKFSGNIAVSASAQAVAGTTAAGTLVVTVTWVPGTGGTTAQRVATVNLNLGAQNAAATQAQQLSDSIVVPVQLYIGTTVGKFQATVTTTGTISALSWDVVVNGNAV